jgi:hypothetical protein
LLDDEGTRDEEGVIRWKEHRQDIRSIKAKNVSGNPNQGVINFGSEEWDWLYSRELHPKPAELEAKVRSMIE